MNYGNLQGIKLDYIGKIRSEALSVDDFHDILLMCNDKENNFVQYAGIPPGHYYSKEQLAILKRLIKSQ
ncbi:Uncharacterized protein FWK35_00032726 [Aphis craccivora]|uniref:Uncharacterized protein n=1 Tax=Aphis craccivora TaxID=307492 RepID=A0A6G0W2N2_APHCR|nr:Uncharacterized protein FWK35_00032726 [Aphis craccivora]